MKQTLKNWIRSRFEAVGCALESIFCFVVEALPFIIFIALIGWAVWYCNNPSRPPEVLPVRKDTTTPEVTKPKPESKPKPVIINIMGWSPEKVLAYFGKPEQTSTYRYTKRDGKYMTWDYGENKITHDWPVIYIDLETNKVFDWDNLPVIQEK